MTLFSSSRVFVGFKAKDKASFLRSAADLFVETKAITDSKLFFTKLLEREALMSTGIGKRIAIPHLRDPLVKDFQAIIYLLDSEIDFNSIDSEKVRLVIVFAIPEDIGDRYMRLLSGISRYLRDSGNRREVFSCSDKNNLLNVFRRIEDETNNS